MPPLKNIRHEKFARAVVKHNGNQTEAYKEISPNIDYDSAKVRASQTLTKANVRERVLEILNSQQRTSLPNVIEQVAQDTDCMKEVLDAKGNVVELRDNQTRIRAKELLLNLHGALERKEQAEQERITINISTTDAGTLQALASTLENMNRKLDLLPYSMQGYVDAEVKRGDGVGDGDGNGATHGDT